MTNAEIARAYLDAVVARDYLLTIADERIHAIDELCTGFFAP